MGSMIGKMVDNYHVLEEVGAGGMGVVYKARDAALDRLVALKVMDGVLSRGEDFLRKFRSEARALARLNNPNIVTVFALREVEFGVCIVMEFVHGVTLARRIAEQGPLSLDTILPIFRQTLTALHHAHGEGIIHRDIKPKNIMLTNEGQVKVTDFGLAKIKQDGTSTVTAGTEGTLYYMSPEQIRGLANVDHRGDIYSVGMTLYECATGTLPFLAIDNDYALRHMIVEGEIPVPERFHPTLPQGIKKIIMKAIAKDPADRYQSALEMLNEIEKLGGKRRKTSVSKYDASTDPVMPVQSKIKRGSMAIAVAMGAILIGIGVVWLITKRAQPIPPAVDGGENVAPARVTIQSEPSESVVFLNGDSVGTTPVEALSLEPGYVAIRVSKSGYMAEDTSLFVKGGEDFAVAFPLTRLKETGFGGLLITSRPTGANVWIDGKDAGRTPYRNNRVVTGEHNIRLVKTDYRQWTNTSVSIDEFVQKELHISLTPTVKSTLFLQALPFGSILVDGTFASTDRESAARIEVPAGARTIVFEHPEYGSKQVKASVREGQVDTVRCYFEAFVNIQTLSVSNELMWGTIVINGNPTDMETPRQVLLGPGTYEIGVQRAGYAATEEPVRLTIAPALERTVYSLVFHLSAQ